MFNQYSVNNTVNKKIHPYKNLNDYFTLSAEVKFTTIVPATTNHSDRRTITSRFHFKETKSYKSSKMCFYLFSNNALNPSLNQCFTVQCICNGPFPLLQHLGQDILFLKLWKLLVKDP